MKMKLQSLRKELLALGILLLVTGVLAPVAGIDLLSLATIIYDATPPSIGTTYPAGTSGAPTGLTPGASVPITAVVTDAVTSYGSLNVKVAVTWSGGSSGDLQMVPEVVGGIYQKHYLATTWNLPNLPNTLFTFTFKAWDQAGNLGTKTTYGVTGKPTGDFYINEQKVTADSVIYLNSPSLSFKVTVTAMANYVNDVIVTVTKGSNTATLSYSGSQLTKSGSDYTCSYSLAWGEGSYTITSQIKDTANQFYTLSVLTMSFGDIPPTPPNPLKFVNLLTVAGAVLCVYAEKNRVKELLK